MEIILALIGITLLTGGTFVSCAIAVSKSANAALGAMRKNPDSFGLYVTLAALNTSQGLYGFVGFIVLQQFLVPEITMFQGCTILFLGIIMAVAAFFTGIKQAGICANGIKSIGEGHNVFATTLMLAVIPELYAILAMLVTILVAGTL